MLDMKLNSGKFVIDDNNETHVDENMMKHIEEEFKNNKDNENKNIPNIIKD
jgi:hypothetical protein